jgi:cell division protein FtsW
MNPMNSPRRGSPDFLLLFLTFLLVCFGLVMIFSASSMTTAYKYEDPWFFTKKQLISVAIGVIGMLFFMNLRIDKLKKLVLPVCMIIFVMLLLVPFIGDKTKGAVSWFYIGSFGLQPTEFAKLGIILYLALLISKKEEKFRDFKKGFLPALLVVGFVAMLIMLQPDLGSCMVLLMCAGTVIIAGGANFKHWFGSAAVLSFFGGIYLIQNVLFRNGAAKGTTDYKADRLTTFLDPFKYKMDEGFQLVQSLYAFGHGGLTGTGYGQGIQKLHYLPEAHNDFIFAIIGEELGFIGVVLFLFIYLLFIWRGLVVSMRSGESFSNLAGVGIMGMIGFQALINIGGVTSSIPLTGVTLPLISYGGSSMMVTLAAMGIVLGISRGQTVPLRKK